MKSVVVYYSRSGNTKKVADKIVNHFNSDVVFVEPKEEYGNYVSSLIRMGKEMKKEEPLGYGTEEKDFTEYDRVFLGFPVWGGVMPQFMQEYVKACNFDGVEVIPFATAGSNGKKRALDNVKSLVNNCNEEAYFYTNLLSRKNVDKWINEIKI